MASIITKLCGKCNNVGEFYVRRNGKSQDCCKKCYISRGGEYQVRERDAVNERARNRYLKNPEKYKKQSGEWYKAHPDVRLQVNRNYSKDHPLSYEANSVYCSRRRAKLRNSIKKLTVKEWKEILNFYNYMCLCCERTDVKLTIDHIVPLVLGGEHTSDNVQPLCKSCNCRKHTKIVDYRKGKIWKP